MNQHQKSVVLKMKILVEQLSAERYHQNLLSQLLTQLLLM
jgi:hypothetical protein